MNEIDINLVLKNNLWQPHFYAVVPRDKLTRLTDKLFFPAAIVVNTGVSGTKGIHWQCVYLPETGDRCLFFCSLGLQPSAEINEFCSMQTLKLYLISKKVQSPFTMTCGLYVCDFLLFQSRMSCLKLYHRQYKSGKYFFNEKTLSNHWRLEPGIGVLKYSIEA